MKIRHFIVRLPRSEEIKKRFNAEIDDFIQEHEKEGLIVIKETQLLIAHPDSRSAVLITLWMDKPDSLTAKFLNSLNIEPGQISN